MKNGLESERNPTTQPIQCDLFFSLGLFAQQNRHMVDFLEFGKHSVVKNENPQTWKAFDTVAVQDRVKAVQNDCNHVQMIFIRQRNSYAALDVSKEMINAIITGHRMDLKIWNILFSFRSRTNDLEETYSYTVYTPSMDGSFEFAYLFKFTDYKGVGESMQWVNRQFGIYQRYHKERNQSVFTIVLPNHEPATLRLQGEIERTAMKREKILENPIYFHLALFKEHVHKARLCLAQHEQRLESIADDAFTFDIKDELPFEDMYENLQSLRLIERKLAPLVQIFCGHRNVLSKLFQANSNLLQSTVLSQHQFDANTVDIQSLHESTSAYEREAEYMLDRVRSTSQLISDTIALKSQNTSQLMSNQMLQDSGTIRVITFVTLIFLPATFVAGFFGMGFFSTENSGSAHGWISSPYLGIYFAVAVPLTVLTLMYWKWMNKRIRKAAQHKEVTISNV